MTIKISNFFFIICIHFIVFEASFLVGQNINVDSLFLQLKQARNDSVKCSILLDIGDYYEHKNIDTARSYYEKSLKLAAQKKLIRAQAQANRYIAALYIDNSDKTISIEHYQKALKLYREINDIKGIAKTYNNIGIIYYKMGNYDVAIENFMKSLKIREKIDDKKGIMLCYLNIGSIHKDQNSYDKALEYYVNALNIAEEINDTEGIYLGNNNLGIMQDLMGNYQKAIEYINKSLSIVEKLSDKKGILMCYNNLGISYKKSGDYDNALINYNKSLKISEEINNKNTSAMILDNLASMHLSLADSAKNKQANLKIINAHLNLAVNYGLRALELGREIMSKPIENNVSRVLMKTYKKMGDKSSALDYAEIFIDTKDSMFNQEKTKSLAEAEKKFESEKKQLQIDKLSKEKELQNETIARKEAESKKQRILIFSFFAGFIIILIFSIFLYRLFNQKKKANLILAKQKQQIEIQNLNLQQANEEINAQRDEIEAQRDLVTLQKEHIEGIHKEFTDSINYAKRIQEAVLPISSEYRSIMGEHFVLFRPKDIVSGDFYWTAKIDNTLIVAVADCTGHGVPGAFMSMLGISFLNEIVRKKEIIKANQVLNELRKEIINALQQKGQLGEQKDGMDISLVAIKQLLDFPNFENLENLYSAQWAGANNPLWIIKSPKFQIQNSKPQDETSLDLGLEALFLELKPDKMPIAIYERMDDFTNHELQLNSGDILYLMTDGYEDQFGGPKGKKFLSKNLKQLIVANCQLPMIEQNENLEKTLIEWIGDVEQIDDITVLGIKI
ncbi:MAG: hypothetical protein A2033_05615 [Bacteroidetes bacterium GWA2_31_9]|nr:MAG: hypothetical protein A2033_05615 [Bacteroidetes bacterium GWA2_31_9]